MWILYEVRSRGFGKRWMDRFGVRKEERWLGCGLGLGLKSTAVEIRRWGGGSWIIIIIISLVWWLVDGSSPVILLVFGD